MNGGKVKMTKYTRIGSLEKMIALGMITLEGFVKLWVERIAIGVDVAGGDLRDDLKLYGKAKDKWGDEFNFEECDKTILYILTHPDKAKDYYK